MRRQRIDGVLIIKIIIPLMAWRVAIVVFRAWRKRKSRKRSTARLVEPCRDFKIIKESRYGSPAELGNIRTL